MDYSYLALKFLIGGGVLVGVTFLAEQADPSTGAFSQQPRSPRRLPFSLRIPKGEVTTQQLVMDAFWFVIPTLLFLLCSLPPHGPLSPSPQFRGSIWDLACGSRGDEPASCRGLKRVPGPVGLYSRDSPIGASLWQWGAHRTGG